MVNNRAEYIICIIICYDRIYNSNNSKRNELKKSIIINEDNGIH